MKEGTAVQRNCETRDCRAEPRGGDLSLGIRLCQAGDRMIYAIVRGENAASVARAGCAAGHTWQAHQRLQLGWRFGRSDQPAR
jgi:hypothetical protein